MGNSISETEKQEIMTTAAVRINYPLYKTEYSNPTLDDRMLASHGWFLKDQDVEKYRYIMSDEIWDKNKKDNN